MSNGALFGNLYDPSSVRFGGTAFKLSAYDNVIDIVGGSTVEAGKAIGTNDG
jgi:hypothetical protein